MISEKRSKKSFEVMVPAAVLDEVVKVDLAAVKAVEVGAVLVDRVVLVKVVQVALLILSKANGL